MTKGNYNFTEQEAKYRAMTFEELSAARLDAGSRLLTVEDDNLPWHLDNAGCISQELAIRFKMQAAALRVERRKGAASKHLKAAAAREEAMLISSGLEYIGNYDAAELEDGLHVVDDQLVRINSGNPEPLDGNDLAVFDAMLDALKGAHRFMNGYAAVCRPVELAGAMDSVKQIEAAILRAEAIR